MNRFILCTIFITTLASTVCIAPPAQERYLQANKLYEQGEYAQAYLLYEGIVRKGPAVLINMGNAAFEQSHFAQALVAWRRAQQQVRGQDYFLIEQRIATLQSQEGGSCPCGMWERIGRRIDVYMRVLPHKVWQLLFLVLLACGLFVLHWVRQRRWLPLVIWASITLVLCVLLMVRYNIRSRVMGVVMLSTPLLVSKDTYSRSKKRLSQGQELHVAAQQDAWCLVSDAIDVGWIPCDTIQITTKL